MPLRVKVAIAGIAGVGAAWLIPRGGTEPVVNPTPTPPGRLTAAEFPLSTIPRGVSFKTIDGVRVFLVRTGEGVVAFRGLATTSAGGPIYWCPKTRRFQRTSGGPFYSPSGGVEDFSAPRHLDRLQVLVAAGRVTIFPHVATRGGAAPPATIQKGPPPPILCTAAERVG